MPLSPTLKWQGVSLAPTRGIVFFSKKFLLEFFFKLNCNKCYSKNATKPNLKMARRQLSAQCHQVKDFKFNVIAALSRNHTITHHALKIQRRIAGRARKGR